MRNRTEAQRLIRAVRNQLESQSWEFDVAQYARNLKMLETARTPIMRAHCEQALRTLEARWPGKKLG